MQFGFIVAGEDDQAAGVAVEAVNAAHDVASRASLAALQCAIHEELDHRFIECRLASLAGRRPVPFLGASVRHHARWLFDHDHMGVGEMNPHRFCARR